MHLDNDFIIENSVKLGVSLILGGLMGAEREYKGRNIGFRTIILITLGSCLFTIISTVMSHGGDPTRIASNVVTGVGFLGAGAIFRDGFTVKGVTTASLIWISAAVGMACGIGLYEFSVMVTATVLVVLIGFAGVQKFIDKYNKEQVYKIIFQNSPWIEKELEEKLVACKLKYDILSQQRYESELTVLYEVRGSEGNHLAFTHYLKEKAPIKSFSA
jgi:putative Mg2+ transporter-C (MgtC) family protein